MGEWQHKQIIAAVEKSVSEQKLWIDQAFLKRWSEKSLIEALDYFADKSTLAQDIVEFLINVRRFHFAYKKNGEVWSLLEQHTNQDFSKLDGPPGPFGLVIQISGHRDGTGFQIAPVTVSDVENETSNYSKFFENVLDENAPSVTHVIYLDEKRTQEHNFVFAININQSYSSELYREGIDELSQLMKTFFSLPKDVNNDTEDMALIRKQTTRLIISSDIEILDLAFNNLSDEIEDAFSHDLFEFLINVIRGNFFVKSNIDSILEQMSEEEHCAVMLDYSPTRRGSPPTNMIITPSVATDVINRLEAEGKSSSQWMKNKEVILKIPPTQIGVIHCDDEMSVIHKFPFDMTSTINRTA